jgi:hypothetical protein
MRIPKGFWQRSPGLRGTSYPGKMRPTRHNPERVVAQPPRNAIFRNPFGVVNHTDATDPG